MSIEITAGAGAKVLVVDDDPVTRSLLGQCLKREGYSIVSASDGMEACSAATSERPDVALVDLLLPRRDGYSVLMYLRSRETLRDLPVILVSAEASGQHQEIARTLGAQRFLTKPCDPGAVMTAVKDALEQKRRTA